MISLTRVFDIAVLALGTFNVVLVGLLILSFWGARWPSRVGEQPALCAPQFHHPTQAVAAFVAGVSSYAAVFDPEPARDEAEPKARREPHQTGPLRSL